ncbi:hypothetical protein E4U54_004346 [Claviceps lovelessii]|nr:hypothetical protein E4U54_004346 [Claviceps lovelessii]
MALAVSAGQTLAAGAKLDVFPCTQDQDLLLWHCGNGVTVTAAGGPNYLVKTSDKPTLVRIHCTDPIEAVASHLFPAHTRTGILSFPQQCYYLDVSIVVRHT